MKIVVDKMPEESAKCIFATIGRYDSRFLFDCSIDGLVCDLEVDCCCEKLITLEDALNGRD